MASEQAAAHKAIDEADPAQEYNYHVAINSPEYLYGLYVENINTTSELWACTTCPPGQSSGGSSSNGGFWDKMQSYTDPILGGTGAIISMAETIGQAEAVSLARRTQSSLNVTRLTTATKFAKGAGVAGLVVGGIGASINITTGNGTGVDVLDIGVTGQCH